MEKYTDEQGRTGVWRTIRGRRVFIRDGEDLGEAMKRSGKFATKFSPEEVDELRNKRNKINPDGRKAKAREIDKKNKDDKLIDNDMTIKELDDTAQWLYDNDRNEWDKFTDNELKELAKLSQITNENPGGRAYDDEVFDEMDRRGLKLDQALDNLNQPSIDDEVNPMEEWSDTTGSGYSDAQMKAYKDYLLETQGTTDEDLINAGREPENKVSIEKFMNEQANDNVSISERDVKDLFSQLNDEGSDFTFGDVSIEDGKVKTDVGVFMPTEEGYTTRELEIPLSENETYDTLEEKMRDWQSRHDSPDSFYDEDFKRLKDQHDYTNPSQEEEIERQRLINDFRQNASQEEYLKLIDDTMKRDISNEEIKEKINSNKEYYEVDPDYTNKEATNVADAFMSADVGDWNNMNQQQRDEVCEKIVNDMDKKYGEKLQDRDFRNQVLSQLEDQNFHTMVKQIDNKYNEKYGLDALKNAENRDTDLQALERKYNERSDTDKLVNDFWKKYSNVQSTKQFNKQVEKDKELKSYMNDNGLELKTSGNEYNLYKDGKKISYLAVDKSLSADVKNKKYLTEKQVNLNNTTQLKNGEYIRTGDSINVASNMNWQDKDGTIKPMSKLHENIEIDDNGNVWDGKTKIQKDRIIGKYDSQPNDREFRASMGEVDIPDDFEAQFNDYAREREERTIPREKAQDFVKAFKTALEEEQNGYTQKVDWDGGTYQYSKDRLDRMEQSGIKPLEHSYTGGGWQGTKYDSKLTTKEIAKTVQDDLKKNYPGVKVSRKTDYNSIDINIMSSDKDLYKTGSDIDRMNDSQVSDTIRDSIGGYTKMDDWLEKNNRKGANGTFTANDERDYLKQELETYRNRQGYRVSGNEWYLSDYGKDVIGSLNKNLNSYNYDDSDGMVDYFDTNFYGGVQIGKWDKPYVVEDKKIEAKVDRYKGKKSGTSLDNITTKSMPKTREQKVLQGNYGSGWDDLVSYEKDNYKQARSDYKSYKENEPNYSHRVVERRVNNEYREKGNKKQTFTSNQLDNIKSKIARFKNRKNK